MTSKTKITRVCFLGKTWNTVWFALTAFCSWTSLKNLPKSSSRAQGMFIPLKFPSTCLYFVFFTVFDDLSAAMKSSSSRLELSSSNLSFSIRRLSSSGISKKPARKSGISASQFFVVFSSFAYFSFKYVSSFSSRDILAIKPCFWSKRAVSEKTACQIDQSW